MRLAIVFLRWFRSACRVKLPVGYAWAPSRSSDQSWNVDLRADLTSFLLTVGLALVLSAPPVATALGIPPLIAAGIVLTYTIHPLIGVLFLKWIRRHPRVFQVRVLFDMVHGVALISALVAATRDPLTPMWSLCVMYSALDGGDIDFPPSVVQLATHSAAPLLAIPVFWETGVSRWLAVGMPVLFTASTYLAYRFMARRSVTVRAAFAERDALRARMDDTHRALERESLFQRLTASIEAELRAARTAREMVGPGVVAAASRRGLDELQAAIAALEAPAAPRRAASPRPVYRAWPRPANGDSGRRVPAFEARLGLPLSIAMPCVISALLPLATRDPTSPLWAMAVFYATVDGSDYDVDASWFHVAVHCGTPLATVPMFLALGASTAAAVGGPVFIAFACFMPFHFGAVRARVVWAARAERERLAGELARVRVAHESSRLARDLHDTVGANLALAALYADLLTQRHRNGERSQHLSEALEGATRQGLEDLHLLLDGIATETGDVAGLAEVIRARAARVTQDTGVAVRVDATGSATIDAAARYAAVRVAHEATSNAIRHGRPTSIVMELRSDAHALTLRVRDDGSGFDRRHASTGRGLANMASRATELGGTFDITSGAGGTTVTARFPQTWPEATRSDAESPTLGAG